MTIYHHPDDATIMALAAGGLGEGFTLLVAAHMEHCSRCRNRLAEAEALGGELLEELPAAEMDSTEMGEVWRRIQTAPEAEPPRFLRSAPDDGLPVALAPYLEGGLASVNWRSLVPGIRQHVLHGIDCGKGSVRLLAIAPGITIPHHTHGGGEMTLILKGSYADEIGRFRSGDLADLDESVHHQPIADGDEACVCLIATDERLRFSGMFSRMLQPLIGI